MLRRHVHRIKTRNINWLVFSGYNPYLSKYDNIIILGDFNSEKSENAMTEFCEVYNLENLVNKSTCFENPTNPTCIDLI